MLDSRLSRPRQLWGDHRFTTVCGSIHVYCSSQSDLHKVQETSTSRTASMGQFLSMRADGARHRQSEKNGDVDFGIVARLCENAWLRSALPLLANTMESNGKCSLS